MHERTAPAGDRHFSNASWSGLTASIRAVAALLSALLAIRLVGVDAYGDLVTWLSLFALYLSLNTSAFTLVVARLMHAASTGDLPGQRALNHVASRFCVRSIAVLAAVTLALAGAAMGLPHAAGALGSGFATAIVLMGTLTAVQIAVAWQAAVVEAAGRLDLAVRWQLAGPLSVLAALGMSFALRVDLQPAVYLIVLVAGGMADLVLLGIARHALGLRLGFFEPAAGEEIGVLQLLRSTGLLQASLLVNVFLEPANKFLLNYFAGAATTALYDIAMKVVWGIQNLAAAAMRVFLHIGAVDRAAVAKAFVRTVTLLGVPVVGAHMAGAIFLYWMAHNWLSVDSLPLMLFLGVATVSNLGMIFVTPLYMSLIAGNDLLFIFRTHMMLAVINIVASSMLIPLLGLLGAAFGLLLATGFNATAIYLRCRIGPAAYQGSAAALRRARRRIAMALVLLVATFVWTIAGDGQIWVLALILLLAAVLMAGEPLPARIIQQFMPRRT